MQDKNIKSVIFADQNMKSAENLKSAENVKDAKSAEKWKVLKSRKKYEKWLGEKG